MLATWDTFGTILDDAPRARQCGKKADRIEILFGHIVP
jgi:hypothetical protein